jgi:hypothetical protein
MTRTWILTVAAALAAASCQTDAAAPNDDEPTEVARVMVSPQTAVVAQGKSVSLTAIVEDAAGRPVEDRAVDWFTYDAAVATVTDGVVTGVAAGEATITATVDGKRGSARVTVTASSSGLVLTSISPNPMVEGQSATLNGSGFGFVPSNLRVTIDGIQATVVATNGTTIQVTVPQMGCKPARNVDVQVRLLASYSNTLSWPVRPAQYVNVPVGQQVLVRNSAEFCLQFAPSNASEAYLIGVQSVAEQITGVTPARVIGAVAETQSADAAAALPLPAEAPLGLRSVPSPQLSRMEMAQMRQRAAEARVRRLDRELLLNAAGRAVASAAASSSAPSIPAGLSVGSVVSLRVPAFVDQCNRFASTTGVVRAITPRAIFLEDPSNPAGGFTLADIQSMANLWENHVYDTDVDYFGAPSDIDGNGRIAIFITKEVNRLATSFDSLFSLGGIVKAANFLANSGCPASNEGEIIYLRAPDVTGKYGMVTGTPAEELPGVRILLAHEFVHAIQYAHQIPGNPKGSAFQPNWVHEGQATFAEEVVGYRVAGRSPGMNYGFAVAYNEPRTVPETWHRAISWMGYYFGYGSAGKHVATAPEQCSWLGFASEGNGGPCLGTDNMLYAMSWSVLRWLADQVDQNGPAAEKVLQRALIDNPNIGFAALSSAVNVPIDVLLALWAAALYVDDRIPGAPRALSFTSWDLTDIEGGRAPNARLMPRQRAFTSFTDAVQVRGGSTAYFRVSGAGRPATAIRAIDPSGSPLPQNMRMWVVRMQ